MWVCCAATFRSRHNKPINRQFMWVCCAATFRSCHNKPINRQFMWVCCAATFRRAMISAHFAVDVGVTGGGVIEGNGRYWQFRLARKAPECFTGGASGPGSILPTSASGGGGAVRGVVKPRRVAACRNRLVALREPPPPPVMSFVGCTGWGGRDGTVCPPCTPVCVSPRLGGRRLLASVWYTPHVYPSPGCALQPTSTVWCERVKCLDDPVHRGGTSGVSVRSVAVRHAPQRGIHLAHVNGGEGSLRGSLPSHLASPCPYLPRPTSPTRPAPASTLTS
jgi:hypothetical protein